MAAQLHERDVDLLVLKQGIDTSTPSVRLQFHMFGRPPYLDRGLR
ncbi:hypothetical protein ABZ907_45150 [Nonomuraea wenchangensis]